MKKGTIQKIEKELDEKRKMPKELKEKVRAKIFTNAAIAICIILYFLFLFLGSANKTKGVRIIDLEIFSSIFLITSITLFEIAYKKDSETLAIHGIETLIVGIITLFLPYIIFELQPQYQIFYNLVGAYFGVYYIIKCICIAVKSKNNYSKSISDVKEIVKKEKRQIKDEDDKIKEPEQEKITENKEEPEKLVEEKKAEKKTVNKQKQAKTTKSKNNTKSTTAKKQTETKAKLTSKNKKESTTKAKETTKAKKQSETKGEKVANTKTTKKATTKNETKKEEKLESTVPKKRGRPKKQETIQKEENKAKAEEPKAENAPKKRGRPRKVVTQ